MWGSKGSGEGQFSHPHGIDVDSSGNVYVADQDKDSNIIQKFMSGGT
jgi:DNA-binding beta-propeller fold protein YncE